MNLRAESKLIRYECFSRNNLTDEKNSRKLLIDHPTNRSSIHA